VEKEVKNGSGRREGEVETMGAISGREAASAEEAHSAEVSSLAGEVMGLARDEIMVHLRFFDRALAELRVQERQNTGCLATDGSTCFYDPIYVLKCYQKNPGYLTRAYLHMLLHCIFLHQFQYDRLERDQWDLAADLAVENVILELGLTGTALEEDELAARKLKILREDVGALTAERIYRYFRQNGISYGEAEELRRLFERDVHFLWRDSLSEKERLPGKPAERLEMSKEQWEKISERVKANLKSFSGKGGSLEENLEEATRDRYDYSEILRQFTVMSEEIGVNDDEFDYVYYTYGLEQYGNLPLIEPLEYKESKKVKEFVIAIDTSASCRDGIVKAFLKKTYSLLKVGENFFHRINVHIIQCDNQVQSDTKITSWEDFDRFLKFGKLTGFGGTDFRPVFFYVDRLREQKEFENLKGLIYFTDGYGIYPEHMPDYQVIFAFLGEDENRGPVPSWSRKVILEDEEFEE